MAIIDGKRVRNVTFYKEKGRKDWYAIYFPPPTSTRSAGCLVP